MLSGPIVDLVPYGEGFKKLEHRWHNSEAWWWATAGDRPIVSRGEIERRHAAQAEHEPGPGVWFGIRTKDGKDIGDISLGWVLPHHRLAMLGAAIGEPEYWGGGYGTDALLLMVEYAFDWLDVHKVWLGTMGINVRVLRQMEKVGFRQEGRIRQSWYADGQWTDDVIFGMLREEWPGREAMIEKVGLRARGR